ncbi:MAG TPA: acyltransferase [Candidatus Deferrimicrobiaceae bacterium]|nr:acyltransferase [Candidatus Deferrimicrobiaceae bacterium]
MEVDANTRSIRSILSDTRTSSFRKYKELTVGAAGAGQLLLHETLSIFLAPLPGAIGIALRRMAYKRIFRSCGKGLIVGRNCVFRHASKISMGSGVTVDDLSLIDARGTERDGILLGDGVIINRNTIVQSKGGDILIGKSVRIGANSTLVSKGGIRIEDDTVIAGGCTIAAGTFDYSDLSRKISEQEMSTAGPIVIGRNVWLATGVTILDGVRIGEDSIVSAGSVVTGNIPPRSIAHGNPAKVVFTRR